MALARATEEAANAGRVRRTEAAGQVGVAPSSEGVYVTFDSSPGFELRLMTFDPQTSGEQPELVAVQVVAENDQEFERATVFVPDGKLGYFISRFEAYATEEPRVELRKTRTLSSGSQASGWRRSKRFGLEIRTSSLRRIRPCGGRCGFVIGTARRSPGW